ncbi:hypothetical protein [Candidatus Palauibacter sp.]|uniref:hypothetical protein n=1 Tax=Candidatus Palauibacter sp. TaxID=3101350 RepID=UPI003B52A12B
MRGRTGWPLVLIAVASLLPGPVAAQASDFDRFRLDTGCAVDFFVHALDVDGFKMEAGVQAETETAGRSRLRAARIYDPKAPDILSVAVGGAKIGGEVHYVFKMELAKRFHDRRTGTSGTAVTWADVANGRFEELRMMLDRFLDEYLRVNECGQ